MNRFKKGDEVIVLSGKEKGKKGEVTAVFPKKQQVVVAKINVVKRHTKPNQKVQQGGILDVTKPLPWSKVALIAADGKKTRVGFKFLKDGKKIRVASRTGQSIDK